MDVNTGGSWGWIALALVNAGLAEQKNRSRLTWFLVSILIGPIATLLIVVWEPAPKFNRRPAHFDRSMALLTLGVAFTLAAVLVALQAANNESIWLWVIAVLLIAAGLGCFLYFIVRWPKPSGGGADGAGGAGGASQHDGASTHRP